MDSDPLSQLRHDLRTPINHILGYSELLAEEAQDAGHEVYLSDLDRIRTAARNLLDDINTRLTPTGLSTLPRPTDQPTPEDTKPRFAERPDASFADLAKSGPAALTGKILVVDDNADNRTVLSRSLQRQGHETVEAENGQCALEVMRGGGFDLVLLDVMMPVMDGYAALTAMKDDDALADVPVLMISALSELDSVVRCIEAGAEDYLPKPFNSTLLRARIGVGLEKKRLRDQEKKHLRTIEETQKRLAAELDEAARYVRSILPEPTTTPLEIEWDFVPSTELGGDSFGYHAIDDDHFAIYLLDVCGHGVGASLLAVAAISALRSGTLPDVDFRDPAQVLSALNDAFPMERHNQMYFTIWYGVFKFSERRLSHASGGHPPALLGTADGAIHEIRSPGMLIGAMPGMPYSSDSLIIEPGSRLVVFSDGAYELTCPDGTMLPWDTFVAEVRKDIFDDKLPATLGKWAQEMHGSPLLEDDLSIFAVRFPK